MNHSLRALAWFLSIALTALPGALIATQAIDNSRLSVGSVLTLVAVCCVFSGLLTAASIKWLPAWRFEARWLICSLIYLPVTIVISLSILFAGCVWDFNHIRRFAQRMGRRLEARRSLTSHASASTDYAAVEGP